MLDIC